MTFPLGSLRADGGASTAAAAASSRATRKRAAPPPRIRPACAGQAPAPRRRRPWLLALLALADPHGLDPAFSTSGSGGRRNKAGVVGAWFSDFAFFLFGYSFWWVLRRRRARLARRAGPRAAQRIAGSRRRTPPNTRRPGRLARPGAAAGGERLARVDPALPVGSAVAGGHAGGVIGYVLGTASMKLLGFAGSGVFWIAVLVAGISLALRFSWLRLAETDRRGRRVAAQRAGSSASSAPRTSASASVRCASARSWSRSSTSCRRTICRS